MSTPASVLNTNLASMVARRNLGSAQTSLAESVERLSSGLRINRASDDAAGMAVVSVVEGQTRVAATAHRNINDAISMVQTGEGALQEANAMLGRIKELATQGANDSMSQEQYYFLVQEMRQLMDELANTAGRTTFNGNRLLGGSPTKFLDAGTWRNGDFSSGLTNWTVLNQRVRLNGADTVLGWPTPQDPTSAPDGGTEAASLSPGVMSFSTNTASGAVEMISNGSPVPNNPVNSGAVVHGPALTSDASLQLGAGSKVSFDWEASAGADAYDVFGYIVDTNTGRTEIILNQTGTAANPYQARTTVTHTVERSGNYKFVFLSGTWDATRGQAVGARLLIDNVVAQGTFVPPVREDPPTSPINFLSGSGLGDVISLDAIPIWDTAESAKEFNNGKGYGAGAVKVGALNALYQRILWLSDPANGPLKAGTGFATFSKDVQGVRGAPNQQVYAANGALVSSLTKSLNDLVDDAMLQINAHRSYFGAYLGRMEHNIANLAAQSENLSAASSRIRDADYGFETAQLTKIQILQQAATAMLAQANAMPNVVLGLLRQS